jgi:predicted small secreted protein
MIRTMLALVLAVCCAGLSACNTISGLGKDVQKGGEKVEDSAEKHK